MSSFIFKGTRLPGQVMMDIVAREKALRKKRGLTQEALAGKADVSLGSLRRFEQTGRISFESLVAICFALGCVDELELLFSRPAYTSIQEVVVDGNKSSRARG